MLAACMFTFSLFDSQFISITILGLALNFVCSLALAHEKAAQLVLQGSEPAEALPSGFLCTLP
ncbi:hypothetical protein BDW67DRAFT_159800 [Aspergillus spinulosporus]